MPSFFDLGLPSFHFFLRDYMFLKGQRCVYLFLFLPSFFWSGLLIFNPHHQLISILRGNNRAALSVWYRFRTDSINGPLSPSALNPGGQDESQDVQRHLSVEAPSEFVPSDNIYGGQYDINETSLYQALEEQGEWWKDSTLERLLDRELVT